MRTIKCTRIVFVGLSMMFFGLWIQIFVDISSYAGTQHTDWKTLGQITPLVLIKVNSLLCLCYIDQHWVNICFFRLCCFLCSVLECSFKVKAQSIWLDVFVSTSQHWCHSTGPETWSRWYHATIKPCQLGVSGPLNRADVHLQCVVVSLRYKLHTYCPKWTEYFSVLSLLAQYNW